MSRIPADFDAAPVFTEEGPAPFRTPDAGLHEPAPPRVSPSPTVPTVLVTPGVDEQEAALARDAQAFVARARAFVVDSPESYAEAGQMIDALKTKKRDVVAWFAPMADAAHKAWLAITTRRAGVVTPLDDALDSLAGKYAAYAREVRAQAEAERRRLEQEAREQEQARLKAEADELARIAAEQRQLAAQASSAEEAQALTDEAEELQQTADATRVAAATVQTPVIQRPAPLAPGGPRVDPEWTFEVSDKLALVKAVAAGTVSLEAVEPSESYLRKRAKADKGTAAIPGVRFFDKGKVVKSRGRK